MKQDIQITKQDLENIGKLKIFTSSIKNIYDKMLNLELNNQKDSEEYKKNLVYLDIARELETQRYAKISLIDAYRYYLKINDDINGKFYVENNLVEERIMSNLLKIFAKNIQKLDTKNKTVIFYNLFDRNILRLALFLNDKKNSDKKGYDTHTNNLYFRLKYYLSFINREVEELLLNSSFASLDDIDIANYLMVPYEGDEDLITKEKDLYCKNVALIQINKLLSITDIMHDSHEKDFEVNLRQLLLESSLVFLDKETIKDINDYFMNKEEDYSHISKYLISEIINKDNNEKIKIKN